uniref:Uncharacterized protein n=1 Tax=Ditylenchus dipsaci TaxID=166011 RepID=A0A915CL96_9BILA
MMRIKEAIQRRKLIQQLNDEYAAIGESEQNSSNNFVYVRFTFKFIQKTKKIGGSSPGEESKGMADHQHAYLALHQFVTELNTRLTDTHRRALRMTWKRLSEAPKTSGRGTLKIMEKIFDELVTKNSDVMSIFYRSAFLKCIDDRRKGCHQGTIATVRDHAHLLIDLIDGIMCVMFDSPFIKPVWDPATIGKLTVL